MGLIFSTAALPMMASIASRILLFSQVCVGIFVFSALLSLFEVLAVSVMARRVTIFCIMPALISSLVGASIDSSRTVLVRIVIAVILVFMRAATPSLVSQLVLAVIRVFLIIGCLSVFGALKVVRTAGTSATSVPFMMVVIY